MNLKKLSRLLIYTTCLLPLFINYLDLLPYTFKWSLDLLIVLIVYGISRTISTPKNKLFRYYRTYTILIVLAIIISAFYNNSNLLLTITTIRKTIIPFILFFIFYTITYAYKNENYKNILIKVAYIQVVIIPIEYLLFLYFNGFERLLIDTVPYNKYDIASGSFGAGGTGVVSVFLVLYFVYSLVYLNIRYSYIFLTPLLFTFAGGANALLIAAMFFIVFFTTNTLKVKIINAIYIGLFLIITVMVSNSIFTGKLIENAYDGFENFYDFSFEDEIETFGTYENKLSRVSGFYYVTTKLNTKGKKILGLGPDAVSNSKTLNTNSYKLGSITDIKNDFLFRFSQSGYLGLIISYTFYFILLFYFIKRYKRNKYYLSGAIIFILFIMSTFYIQTINSQQIMSFIGVFLASSSIQNENKLY